MSDYVGLDYSLGRSNFDPETGIHFGVISVNSVDLDLWSEAESIYPDPTCPKCGATVKPSDDELALFPADYDDEDDPLDADGTPQWFDGKDFTCVPCKTCYWSDDVTAEEPIGHSYEDDGYKLTDCLDNDIMVLASPYYTHAQFCSPCVPGAGNLDTPVEDGPKTFALGHDWFEDNAAPYPLYRVSDNARVLPPPKCDSCQMLAINGVNCHESGCPNERKTWDGETWILYRKCRECGSDVRDGDSCCQDQE